MRWDIHVLGIPRNLGWKDDLDAVVNVAFKMVRHVIERLRMCA
jgi:hypothetical protein